MCAASQYRSALQPGGFLLAASLISILLLGAPAGLFALADGTLLQDGTLYPRLVRIEHGTGSANGRILASTTGRIFESTDDGKSFHLISRPAPRSGSVERCCATLYELPQSVGALRAGTLLYSASYFQGKVPAIEVYASQDEGHTWSYHSTLVQGGSEKHGLWEPQFSIAGDGALVAFWSDETDPCCSQKLAQARTYDGKTWSDKQNTIATAVESDRPGMIVTTRLPNNTYFMTYEVCGHFGCSVFSRTSADGWNYGDSRSLGQLVRTKEGEYFAHAPANFFVSNDGGSLLVIGQMLMKSNGTVDTRNNGHTIFRTTSLDGQGAWTAMESPLDIPRSFDNYCPNYSTALLPSRDGLSLLELASDYDASNKCVSYFTAAPWTSLAAEKLTDKPVE